MTNENYTVLNESEASDDGDEDGPGNGSTTCHRRSAAANQSEAPDDVTPAADDRLSLNRESHHAEVLPRLGCWQRLVTSFKENWRLFAIKPVLVIYGLQWAITGSITTQLWLERTCSVIFGLNETVCTNLTDPKWNEIEIQVQQQVTDYQIVDQYLSNIAPILVSLYLGPVSDKGRKLLMYVPFSGHIFSGVIPLLFLYYKHWPPQVLWLVNIYTLGGGYTVLQIAMYGYIGDITNQKNRTVFMALLAGLGIMVFPAAEAVGGQLFKYFGYFTVYGVSLAFTFIGLIYIYFVPESVTKRSVGANDAIGASSTQQVSFVRKVARVINEGNQTAISSAQCLVKPRTGSRRAVVIGLVSISVISSLERSAWSVGLLYTERKFGWNVVDYTNFSSFLFTVIGLRAFVTTPILCYFLGIHDCMLAITGGMASITGNITFGLATKGWMAYYAMGLTLVGGIEGTPLRSLLSKCVGLDEFGKIFTMSSVASSLSSLVGATIMPKLYAGTVATVPGAVYFFMASVQLLCIICMAVLYHVIRRHEKVHGVIGSEQDDFKQQQQQGNDREQPHQQVQRKEQEEQLG